ncbi:MAG TPA: hypothetical protein ENO19_08980 [Halothiobacillaceae bacterium]|nr:hypothetical protein [Halothiobacillaceae bacterium]
MDVDGIHFDPTPHLALPAAQGGRPGDGAALDPAEAERRQVARDFESLFLHQLLQTMRDTIPESDLEDESSEQIQGMAWSFLAQAMADQGGLGLWKTIYDQMPPASAPPDVDATGRPENTLDERL